ncbi:MAG: DUF1674 domain-containing protein [Pseudomonadota bacterium]
MTEVNDTEEKSDTGNLSEAELRRRERVAAAAERARAEAEARRSAGALDGPDTPPEKGGQDGPDPARYGDWEKAGIVSDF